jgi:hypothetical protein
MAQSQGGQAVSVEERILFLAESPDCNHPRELRAIAFQVRKLEDRIKLMNSTGDELLEWLKDGTISDSNYRLLANAWQRAKENKP